MAHILDGITKLPELLLRLQQSVLLNIEVVTIADTGAVNTEFTVTHHLGYVPTGYILCKTDKACNIYTGSTAWTAAAQYLKCDVANCAVKIIVF